MDELGTLFSLSNLPGHVSYFLIAISYWLTDIFWLRVVAVIARNSLLLAFRRGPPHRHWMGSDLHHHLSSFLSSDWERVRLA